MRNARRPNGRFFCLLIAVSAAGILPLVIDTAAQMSSPALTRVADTVYRADGTAAKGTVLISWPAFTTADGKAVAAGSLSAPLGNGGAFAASLAPNTGAQPAGVYYKVVYQLAGQEPSTEYWVVPAMGPTSIGAVRAKLMPPTVAAQMLTRDFADSNYVRVTGDQKVNGTVTFTTPPAVPTPENPGDAASKGYVDAANANLLAAPAPIGDATPNSGTFTSLSAQSLNSTVYVQCPNCTDWGAAINAAINSCASGYGGYKACKVVLPFMNGPQTTPVVIPGPNISLVGQSRTATVLNCTVRNGDCLLVFPQPATVQPGGEIANFSIIGNSAAGQNLIHARDLIGFSFHDLFLDGANGSGGACFWVEAYRIWVERNAFRDINTGYNCAKTWRLSADPSNPFCNFTGGVCSLGYNQWDNIQGNPNAAGQIFWSQEGAALVYGGSLRTVINKGGAGAIVFHWQDTAQYRAMDTHIHGEENGSGGYLFECGAGNEVFLGADVNFAILGQTPPPNHVQSGCNFVNTLADVSDTGSDVVRINGNLGAGGLQSSIGPGSIGTWLTPIYYDLSHYTPSGVGFNARYAPGSGWTLSSDGSANGGGFITNDRTNKLKFYIFPNSGNSIQTIPQTSLEGYLHSVIDVYGSQTYYNTADTQWGPTWVRPDVLRQYGMSMKPSSDPISPYRWLFGSYDGSIFHDYWDARFDGSFNFQTDPNLNGHGLKQGNSVVIDGAGNAALQNLTVNGTCTGCGSANLASPPSIGSTTPNAGTFTSLAGVDLSVRDIPGHEYFVSKYASIQAAIDAAYNNGTVQGGAMVIDDRPTPYSGPGFMVRDSVTLKLAATTYTITGTVTNNNGIANVKAGIISMPGSHIVGAGTSANHGTNVNAGAGLNADLIATSTVGTGAGANAQWWHWGSIENFHMDGKKTQQTAGSCINVENMGETAVLRALEVGNCYADDIRLEGNFATQSEISNVTVNSAGQYGVNLDNFQGVGVLRGLSGDSNATSIIRFNGSQSATLTVLGLKSEEEISGHDPLITIDMPADGSQPAFYLVGGYTYARTGVHDVIKIINGKSGAAPFVTVNNFYVDANFVNAVNDTVNSRTFAASNMNKVPFSYLPTGAYQSGQAFTFAPGTFIQGGSSALTEIFGSSTDGSSMIAAQGNGDGTSYFTGGLKIGIPNRTQFGQPPEMMARMGSRFLGAGNGYDANTWVFVPIWKSGDSSNRWIGEPNQRWPEVYATDVNATTATVGTLNVTSCVGCAAAQVNADWNASSGVAQVLNKPVMATVATSGSYNDLANKPTIPAAQVNADWNASSGVAQVLNKPTIPAASASTPAMNGVGAAGASSNYARADHVHPSDTSRVATSTTVNGHALSGNVTVTASDVGAMHMVSGTLVGPSSGIVGNSGDQNMFSVTIPANTVAAGSGIRCYARWAKTSGNNAVTYKWTLGSTTFGTQAVGASTSVNWVTDVEIFTPASVSSEVITANPIIAGTSVLSGPQVGLTASETMSSGLTLKMTFNATSGETVTPKTFYCTTVQ
jgi:hypothetical protein